VNAKKYSILVVDDDPPILELLGEYLSTRGHDCKMASNTTQALDLLERTDFDVLLTDLKMPGGGGLRLLRNIKDNDMSIAIIMMTGYGTIESALQAMKHGAHDYLLKPFKLRDVHHSMEQAISKQLAEHNTIRLKHIVEIQELVANTTRLEQLECLYKSLANVSKSELSGTGAIVSFFETDRGTWQEYYRTDEAPMGRIDIQSIGQALHDGRKCGDKLAWFSTPRPLVVVPIHATTSEHTKRSIIGFVAVTDPSKSHSNPYKILNVYGSIVGTAISLCLAKNAPEPTNPESPEDHKATLLSLLDCVVNELGFTPDESATAHYAMKMSSQPHSTLRERYDGAPMDIMTIGGGGLPFKILSRLEPLLLAVSERHDGQGSPSGLVGEKIDRTAQAVHIVSIFETLTSKRGFAHTMSKAEALETIKSRYAESVAPEVIEAFINALEKAIQD
jgi:response regulator RpfG family c-di-GMP phosphodiesterase